jgi:GWxTD domain-containing protein
MTIVQNAVGWTLLHSLWEGAAIALGLAVVLSVARSSRVRYAAACFAMLAFLLSTAVTLYRVMPHGSGNGAQALILPSSPSLPNDSSHAARPLWDASDLPPWLAPLWLVGVLLFQVRCLAGWMAASRLRRLGVCRAPDEWVATIDRLRARLRMTRSVTLLESCLAEVPVVIGHLRPVILMPVGLLAGLPAGQIESILLHELAHIQRADYLVNLMQTLVEGLLFYHPAVWWISSVIRNERENCCDELVVETSGNPHEYATALAALETNRGSMVVAATGGNLVKRVRRILGEPEGPRIAIAPILATGIVILCGAAVMSAWQAPAPKADSPYDKWVKEEVVYIITDQERAAFQALSSDEERAHFIEQFWERRDPTPGTVENEYRDEHYRRIAYANNRFESKVAGWKTDRGRIYIKLGPPDEIESHPSGGKYTRPAQEGGGDTVTYPFEQWLYRHVEGIGERVIIEFVDKEQNGEYRMTMDPKEKVK